MKPAEGITISVTKDGPYLVEGTAPMTRQTILSDAAGASREWEEGERFALTPTRLLCRCGASRTKPFCDGSHTAVEFDGTETATYAPFAVQATAQIGPRVALFDAPALCAYARFCDVAGQIWGLVERDDDNAAAMSIREAGLCPSGRLVVRERGADTDLEPELEPSLGIVSDPGAGVAGPLWVRGGISVTSADGRTYEIRNRVTLCRCGASSNKPFCDASHVSISFTE